MSEPRTNKKVRGPTRRKHNPHTVDVPVALRELSFEGDLEFFGLHFDGILEGTTLERTGRRPGSPPTTLEVDEEAEMTFHKTVGHAHALVLRHQHLQRMDQP